ncbi:hypothetical protein E1218_26050 [Kribbella turkmenica]|uniref:DUF4352 domain-containing protein n=1 Tax=Kribbella turkmenica TaxID=2530375 RepID=A0A4R4WLP1_9ACTN|nr:hypothetical protein [Kribbella turkmenica]TDD18457.1 hypothetical protein E1218_26050 [Kribbella turkmenica]
MKLYRPATVAVGVLFVLLGGLTRLATPEQVFEEQNLEVVSGTIGEALRFAGGDSTVTVTRMEFAKSVVEEDDSDDGEPLETNGVYVALEWDTVRGVKKPDNIAATLTADGGTVYLPIEGPGDSGIDFPTAGFAKTGAVVFEVNPTDLKGLTLNGRPSGMLFNVLNSYVEVDLGIPSEDVAQQLVDGAEDHYVLPQPVTRVASS